MAIRKSNSVTAQPDNQRRAVATASPGEMDAFGAISPTDIVMPRLKLLQGMSPEVKADPRANIQGEFYHTGLGSCMGDTLRIVPVLKYDTSWDLWGDRDSNEGLLAQADEKGNWLNGAENKTFVIGRRKVFTDENMWKSKLYDFGSSDPNNPNSKPLLAETYRIILWLLDHPGASPIMFIASRMIGRRVKELLTRMRYRGDAGTPYYRQVFEMRSNLDRYRSNEYFTPHFASLEDELDDTTAARIKAANSALQGRTVKTAEDNEETGPRGPRGPVDASDRASY